MRANVEEVTVHCRNCGAWDTLDFINGEMDTVRMEEHGGKLCKAQGKYYQFDKQLLFHKCSLTGEPVEIKFSRTVEV